MVGTIILVLFVVADLRELRAGRHQQLRRRCVRRRRSGTLVEAGDEEVTERDFSKAHGARARQRAAAESRGDYATIAGEFDRAHRPADRRRRAPGLRRATDLLVSRKLVDAEIASLPQTRGLDGKFSRAGLCRHSSPQQRLTDATVRHLFDGDLARRLMLGPVAANARVPVGVATPYASMLLEQRRGELVLVDTARSAPG